VGFESGDYVKFEIKDDKTGAAEWLRVDSADELRRVVHGWLDCQSFSQRLSNSASVWQSATTIFESTEKAMSSDPRFVVDSVNARFWMTESQPGKINPTERRTTNSV